MERTVTTASLVQKSSPEVLKQQFDLDLAQITSEERNSPAVSEKKLLKASFDFRTSFLTRSATATKPVSYQTAGSDD